MKTIVHSRHARYDSSGELPELTDFDQKLIAALQTDGRTPYTTLARTLGVSEAAVQRRTQQLIEHGYFKIVGAVDPLRTRGGHAVVVALRCETQSIVTVANAVAAIPEIRFLSVVTGTYDVVCELVTFDRRSTTKILLTGLSSIPGIRAMNTSWVLKTYKTNFRWDALGRQANGNAVAIGESFLGGTDPLALDDLDELDECIVDLLQEDGRASYAQIASRLETTISTARRRTLRLLQSGYVTVVALGNPLRLGFEEVVLLWLKAELDRTETVIQALEREPVVRYLSRVAGEADILAEVLFPHRASLLAFLDGPLAAIEGIREVALSFELSIRKRGYTVFE
jgi:DNA-binding Lrp family transcriptional regulator